MPSFRKIKTVVFEELCLPGLNLRLNTAQFFVSLLPYLMFLRVRTALYRWGGVRIGKGTTILGKLRLWGGQRLTIGADTRINSPCAICIDAPVFIGNGVTIGHDVIIVTGHHEFGPPSCRCGEYEPRSVVIEDGVWLGAGVVVLPGVRIGAGSVVSAGSVVMKDVPPDALVAGIPARVVKQIPAETPSAETPETEATVQSFAVSRTDYTSAQT